MPFRVSLRAISLVALTTCAVAILVARSARPGARFRIQCDSHRSVFSEFFFKGKMSGLRVVDTKTGALSALPLPRADLLQWASFSEWLDERGEWHVVGRWAASCEGNTARARGAVGLARFSYPTGRPLDRIADCPLPVCAPCWYPGAIPRVLFPAANGTLFQCTFAGEELGLPGTTAVQPVSWSNPPAPLRDPVITCVVWPKGLGGCVIATLYSRDQTGRHGPQRLWWLRLSSDGLRVNAAGPVPAHEPDDDPGWEYRFPEVASLADGSHWIAYQRRMKSANSGALIVAPLTLDSETGAPKIEAAKAWKVADDIIGAPTAFSPDATLIYALQIVPGADAAIRQFRGPAAAQRVERAPPRSIAPSEAGAPDEPWFQGDITSPN